MENEWILLCSASDEFELYLLKEILNENDIPSVIINKRDSVYLIGEVELRVRSSDLLRAKQIMIKNNEE